MDVKESATEKLNKAVKLLVKINSCCRGNVPYEGYALEKMISDLLGEIGMPIDGEFKAPDDLSADLVRLAEGHDPIYKGINPTHKGKERYWQIDTWGDLRSTQWEKGIIKNEKKQGWFREIKAAVAAALQEIDSKEKK